MVSAIRLSYKLVYLLIQQTNKAKTMVSGPESRLVTGVIRKSQLELAVCCYKPGTSFHYNHNTDRKVH